MERERQKGKEIPVPSAVLIMALAVVLQHCPAGQKADSVGIMDFFLRYNRLRWENFFKKV
jgi:hypothetical protein